MKQSEAAREMLQMIVAQFYGHVPKAEHHFDTDEVLHLAQAAAALFEATGKYAVPEDPSLASVRISNLEAQNDNLRVNNEALLASNRTLAEALEKMANPVHVVTNNFSEAPSGSVLVSFSCPSCGARDAKFKDGQCQSCGEPSK